MPDRSSWGGLFRRAARAAGRTVGQTVDSYRAGRGSGKVPDGLPADEEGNVRIVCRRYAEKREVELDDYGRPECFEADHVDCEGCLEDLRDDRIETW